MNKKADHASADFTALNDELQDLQNQWRKVGRVPLDRNQPTWDQFYSALDKFNELRYKHDTPRTGIRLKRLFKKSKSLSKRRNRCLI